MIATPRIQRKYDPRLQAIVISAGSIDVALEHGIPRSTARGWLGRLDSPSVISTDVVHQDAAALQLEVLELRRKVKRMAALLRLMFVIFKISQFSFARIRVQEAKDKRRLLKAIDQCREHMPLRMVTRIIGLSRSRYYEWTQVNPCGLDDRSSCPKKSVHQITQTEIGVIRDMVTSDQYRHIPTAILARLAERLGKVFVSASTWYRLIGIYKWRRPRLRIYPAKPKIGIRASKSNEVWHVDTTQIRLLDGRSLPGVDVDEVVQQTFVEAFQSIGQFKTGTNLHAWLFAIARYQLMMETTRLRRAADYHAKYVPVALARATEMQLQAELDDSARADHLRDCMDELLEHARKLLRERYESGRTFAQIADLLGRSEGAIRKQLWRHWSAWHHFVAPDNHTEINVIRADAGRTMSYVQVVAERTTAKCEEYCSPDPLKTLPTPEYKTVLLLAT